MDSGARAQSGRAAARRQVGDVIDEHGRVEQSATAEAAAADPLEYVTVDTPAAAGAQSAVGAQPVDRHRSSHQAAQC